MKNKKWLLIFIIAFPSFFWLILESSKINSKKLPHYGPKLVKEKNDTLYYRVTDRFYSGLSTPTLTTLSREKYPLYAIVFIQSKFRKDAYRLTGLWEYLNYKKDKVKHIPFILVTESENGSSQAYEELSKLSQSPNVHFYHWQKSGFDSLVKSYFEQKPYYIDYSFFMLVDANRNIRGYYDARYVSEMKRLIEEYQHLRLKEEKTLILKENEIRKEP
ncbi:MAG: hypothetical protein PSX36_09945 [bacterium]|nr:hypothetical protein [bacterium]